MFYLVVGFQLVIFEHSCSSPQ